MQLLKSWVKYKVNEKLHHQMAKKWIAWNGFRQFCPCSLGDSSPRPHGVALHFSSCWNIIENIGKKKTVHVFQPNLKRDFEIVSLNSTFADEVAEWLRRWTANPMGSARVGSNPILVEYFFFCNFPHQPWCPKSKVKSCHLGESQVS